GASLALTISAARRWGSTWPASRPHWSREEARHRRTGPAYRGRGRGLRARSALRERGPGPSPRPRLDRRGRDRHRNQRLRRPDRDGGARHRRHLQLPFAEDGFFCKHGVATVLAWLRAEDGAPGDDEPQRAPVEENADYADAPDEELLRETLAQKPLGELVDLLIDAAQRDGLLCARLLVDAGFPRRAAELCLFALGLVEEFDADVDGSGGLAVAVEQIEETHLRASRAAEPEP